MFRDPADLSPRAKQVLAIMRDHEHDSHDGWLVQEGVECWIGDQRTSHAVVKQLIECCFVSEEQSGGRTRMYSINDSGKRFLDGLEPYRDGDGFYHATMFDLEARRR